MGHSSIQVTVGIYGYLVPGSNKQAVDRLDEPVEKPQTEAESAAIRNQDLEREAEQVGFGGKDVDFEWSRRVGLNHRPADYESAALPLSYAGSIGVRGNFRILNRACQPPARGGSSFGLDGQTDLMSSVQF